jgi:iron complex transport system substrate-binding protein
VPPTAALDEIAPVVRIVGAALGEEERAEAMASAVEERLAALRRSLPPHRPSAVLFQARGFVAGAPSLSHDILTLAGLSNRAAEAGLGDWASIGVEGLIRLAPEIVILDEDVRQGRSLAHELLSGRAMREFLRARRVLRLGTAFAACGVPETLDAIDLLKERASPAAIARAQ